MNEQDAIRVVLVQAFETQGAEPALLSDADRHHATRAALEAVGPDSAPDAFIAARARIALDAVETRMPVVNGILRTAGWHAAWLPAAILLGALLGITADVFGSGRELNLLAPPAWLVILWNLGVYALLCARALGAGTGAATSASGWIARGARALLDVRLHRLGSTSVGAHSRALASFGTAWTRTRAPLSAARAATLLHAASAAVGAALIAGMYLRGLVLEYRVGWSSTFLQAQTVHDLLALLLAPAVHLSGIALPDAPQMEALRDASALGREQASAAPWIHLYAVMLALLVVVPRALLALGSGWRAEQLRAHFPLALEDSYFRTLLRVQRGDVTQVLVLPYGSSLGSNAQQHLRNALALAFENAPLVDFEAAVTLGAEDDLASALPTLGQASHLVAVYDMTATPEAEHHGAFLRALQSRVAAPLMLVVNASRFASRFRDYPARQLERREAWSRFARSVAIQIVFLDLEHAPTPADVREIKRLIDETTEVPHG